MPHPGVPSPLFAIREIGAFLVPVPSFKSPQILPLGSIEDEFLEDRSGATRLALSLGVPEQRRRDKDEPGEDTHPFCNARRAERETVRCMKDAAYS